MERIWQYSISVVSAAIICTSITALIPKGIGKEFIKLICGVYMTIVIISPVSVISLKDFSEFTPAFLDSGKSIAASGQEMAQEAVSDIIKSETEAYILEKARELNADIKVSVEIDMLHYPRKAVLFGDVSPYVQKKLEQILEEEMGITKENQEWTG